MSLGRARLILGYCRVVVGITVRVQETKDKDTDTDPDKDKRQRTKMKAEFACVTIPMSKMFCG
jgi:hypothetical protein